MIKVNEAVKCFEGYRALDGLNMNVQKGSVYGLIGPNGAGKTTVLKTIAGVYTADSGSVTIDGEEVFENINAKKKMFFINDDLYFFSAYSIKEAAEFYAGIYPSWSWERFENLKAVFNIDTKRKIRKLSKGMQKQVGFWIAISAMPDVLLLDEPVDGLDPVMRRNVWATVLQDVAERGTTVLVSSHSLRELEEVCDHVGIVHQGKVVLEKALDDVKGRTHKLQLAFGGEIPDELIKKLNPLHTEKFGSVSMLIVRGEGNEIINTVHCYNPLVADILPLTLEEVFIYELGGMGYEFKNVIL